MTNTDLPRSSVIGPSPAPESGHPFLRTLVKIGLARTVESNSFGPHKAIEQKIRQLGFDYTMLRASFFKQNLSTIHQAEIRDCGEIDGPAGLGRTSFVDLRDLATVAVKALLGHLPSNMSYP